MGLLKYNTTNVAGVAKGTPTIRFSRNGASSISAAAAQMMGLEPGDKVSFMMDEDSEKGDWSMIKDPTEGFELRKNGNGYGLLFNSAGMANLVLQSQAVDDETNAVCYKVSRESFEVEGEDSPGWTIIMASGK